MCACVFVCVVLVYGRTQVRDSVCAYLCVSLCVPVSVCVEIEGRTD